MHDITLGSGELNRFGEWIKATNMHYFMCASEAFLADHLPSINAEQKVLPNETDVIVNKEWQVNMH